MKIDHINIAAPMALLNEVRDFYCGALQLEEGPRPDFGIAGYWLYGDGNAIIHLIESDNHFPSEKQHYMDHVAFEVVGLQSYIDRLASMGVEYTVSDIPDFNICELIRRRPATPSLWPDKY